jgi:hypothetical protein
MKAPNFEIIRGDVSSRKTYIGAISYFSSGRFWRGFQVGASCAEALESAIVEIAIRVTADNPWLTGDSLFFMADYELELYPLRASSEAATTVVATVSVA